MNPLMKMQFNNLTITLTWSGEVEGNNENEIMQAAIDECRQHGHVIDYAGNGAATIDTTQHHKPHGKLKRVVC